MTPSYFEWSRIKRLGRSRYSAVVPGILIVLVVLLLVGLLTMQPITSVSIGFEGPWAFVADPQDSKSILAIAPITKSHYPLTFGDSHGMPLYAGVYTLDVPGHRPAPTPKLNEAFLRTRVAPENVANALRTVSIRYAIRVPRPVSYVPLAYDRSRIGNEPERSYVTSVSLIYNVKDFRGLSLTGNPDSGSAFLGLHLQGPTARFTIAPIPDPSDVCDVHTREAFHQLAKLLSLEQTLTMPTPRRCQMKMQ